MLIREKSSHCDDTEERVLPKSHIKHLCFATEGCYLNVYVQKHGSEADQEELSDTDMRHILDALDLGIHIAMSRYDYALHAKHQQVLEPCVWYEFLSFEVPHLLLTKPEYQLCQTNQQPFELSFDFESKNSQNQSDDEVEGEWNGFPKLKEKELYRTKWCQGA